VAGRPVSESDLVAFFEGAPTPIMLLDATGRIGRANPEAERVFGRPGRGLVGRPFLELFPPSTQSALRDALTRLAEGSVRNERVTGEAYDPAGSGFPSELTLVRLSDGPAPGLGAVVRDLRPRAMASPPGTPPAAARYSLPELLMANRLKELV
jgi:PAS domain S-box-containing protein